MENIQQKVVFGVYLRTIQGGSYDPQYNPQLGADPIHPIFGNIGVDLWAGPFQTAKPKNH